MTPKERAIYLVNEMNFSHPEHEKYVAKQCALIAADETKNEMFYYCDQKYIEERLAYWNNVKEEINKL